MSRQPVRLGIGLLVAIACLATFLPALRSGSADARSIGDPRLPRFEHAQLRVLEVDTGVGYRALLFIRRGPDGPLLHSYASGDGQAASPTRWSQFCAGVSEGRLTVPRNVPLPVVLDLAGAAGWEFVESHRTDEEWRSFVFRRVVLRGAE